MAISETVQFILDSAGKLVGISMVPVSNYINESVLQKFRSSYAGLYWYMCPAYRPAIEKPDSTSTGGLSTGVGGAYKRG